MGGAREHGKVRLLAMQYHRVGAPCTREYPGMSISPELFAKQVRWLHARGFTSISPSQWARARNGGEALPSKPLLLIFDDGYQDLTRYAFPVLQSIGMSCAVALVTSEIGGVNQWDINKGFQEHKLLDDSEIKDWSDRGVEFISHSHTHADLSTLSEPEINHELSRSKSTIEMLTSRAVTSLVYPYTRTSDLAVRLTERYYELAFSGIPGVNTITTPSCLQRRVAAPQTFWRFRWVVASAGWDEYHQVREQIHSKRQG
jgi:peptidoglycan/xylan/chitin deacetylase (PgdA/CDA1 family)